MKSRISLVCIVVLLAMVVPASAAPDLSVTDVLVNPGDTRSDDILRVYVNGGNVISAVVQNAGPDAVTGGFEVCFAADGAVIGCANVTGGLATDANTTISIDWTPSCEDYLVMPGFPPQSLPITITVTVDCNCSGCPNCLDDGSCGKITESDETNNVLSKDLPAIQDHPATNGVIGGVVNNGYMSKNFDCNTTEEPLTFGGCFDLVGGGMTYNMSGAKISTFAPQATDTRVHHIDLPDGAVVLGARLWVHWYDQWENHKTYPTGCMANLSVNFDGTDLMPEVVYHDSKGFGKYQSPKGCSVFNVTSLVSGSGDYTVVVKNIEPSGGNNTTLLGEGLGALYAGAHGYRVQLWLLEGTDYLMAADDMHGSHDYSVSPDEATATVALPGEIDLTNVVNAELVTFVTQGMGPGSDLLFNGEVIKTDAWNASTEAYPGSKINVEEVSVLSKLLSSNNSMGFRDNGSGGMQAACAILAVVHAPASDAPDLEVSDIYPDYVFANLTNVISLNVMNAGDATADSCNVSLTIAHTGGPTTLTGSVPVIDAGNSTVVEVGNWKPTVLENISMTAFVDCNSSVDEGTDETNNELTVSRNTTGNCSVDTMLPDTCFGYRGQNPMTTVYSGTGGVIYSVGDYKYKNNTVNFTIEASGDVNQIDGSTAEIPAGATITNATLYVYYSWRKTETGPNPGADPRLDFEMSIGGGSKLTTDEYYADGKGFAGSQYQYGTLVYDVTADVTENSAYQAVRSNCTSTSKGHVSGMALLIIYDDGGDKTYSIAHGYDRLATCYSTDYNVLPEDATTTATLTDMDPNTVAAANLFTVTVDAVPPGSESQQFNSGPWQVGAWMGGADYNHPLGFNRRDVTSYITPSGADEVVQFQERTSNGFAPVFACLQEGDPWTDSDSDGVPDCWDLEEDTPSGYLTDSDGRGYRIGDVNRDGKLTSVDALMILQAAIGNLEL